MCRRNPIQVIGDPMRKGVTWLSDELIRSAAHDDLLGSDGFTAMAFLLSWARAPGRNKRPGETSAAQISEQYGWGRNRERASRAISRAVKDGRLIIREYLREGALVPVKVRYDDYGAVVDIDATTQIAEFQTTRDGAYEALFYTAQY